ncbi:hypothetical protein LTR64_001695 [Lithohypha guttulata]|uniref:uncharacterized protein n=1 Tax=Lithohypha guttulata TaxID=1690604 RepID=UPI002DDEAC0B|nr:hypothetical protein LTR51_003889 [Lithohypha guttulata]
MSAYAGNMPHGSYTPLPPINSQYPPPQSLPPANQNYMAQPQFRDNIRYSHSQNPSPAGTPDNRYAPQMAPHQPMSNMSQPSMLPQPQSQTPQPQPPYTQAGARPSSYPQPLAPAPPRSSMNDPYGSYGQQGERPWTGAEQMPGMTIDVGRDPSRTHVVGSQGRRGILPSAPGRPPVMQNGLNGSPKGNTIPQKDADGKFPCPNCTKTYLHAKHLKRHMLRHTGDRPYMCVLCTDTFSRSDILKRHFQKCSVRRGNPTGASHLSNPAAHLKKSQAAAQKAAAAAASAHANSQTQQPPTPGQSNGAGNAHAAPSTGAVQPSPYATTMAGSSMPATTASLPAMASMPFANGSGDSKPQIGQQEQNGANWGMHNGRGGQLMYSSSTASPAQAGHHVENDWNQFLPPAGEANYMNQMYGYGEAHPEVKGEPHEAGSNGYYMPSGALGADGIASRSAK